VAVAACGGDPRDAAPDAAQPGVEAGTDASSDAGVDATPAAPWANVATGRGHACGIHGDGSLYCWGYGLTSTPTEVAPGTTWSSVSLSYGIGDFGLRPDGTLWETAPLMQMGDATWRSIATVGDGLCGIHSDGTLWCTGWSYIGGFGVSTDGSDVQMAPGADWATVDGAGDVMLATKTDGTVWWWGHDASLTLGYDALKATQATTGGASWAQLGLGDFTRLAGIHTDGTLWRWHDVGDLAGTPPIQIGTDTDWIEIAAEAYHSCARKADATVWCWGFPDEGALGNGSWTGAFTSTPVQAGTAGFASITAGDGSFSCGLRTDATIECWGDNEWGQLGTGTDAPFIAVPTQIAL
jgi:alpha-tubulin suppressor-like RCC1 family protein